MTVTNKLDSPMTIWRLLAELAKQQENMGIHGNNKRSKRLRLVAKGRYTPINRDQLVSAKESDLCAFGRMYLHLPPDEKGSQPVLRASFETNDDGHTVFRVKAAILVEQNKELEDGKVEQVHYGVGVRFEGPEGAEGASAHDYYHAQWFSAFEKGMDKLPGCPEWLPDVHPAIPIPAKSAVDVLCCALKSFYGSKSEPLGWLAKIVTTRENIHTLGTETRDQVKFWAGA